MKNLTPWGPHLYGWDSEPLEKSRKIYGRLRIPKAQRKAVLKPLWRTPALSSNQNLDETEKRPPQPHPTALVQVQRAGDHVPERRVKDWLIVRVSWKEPGEQPRY